MREYAALLATYRLGVVEGDRYAGQWPGERFQAHGVRYDACARPKSELYQALMPLVNAGRVELLDDRHLRTQLLGLERRTSRGGRDTIDHRPGSHDDLANAVAGVTVAVETRGQDCPYDAAAAITFG